MFDLKRSQNFEIILKKIQKVVYRQLKKLFFHKAIKNKLSPRNYRDKELLGKRFLLKSFAANVSGYG